MPKFKNKYKHLLMVAVAALVTITSCSPTRHLVVRQIKPMNAGKIIRKVSKESPSYDNYETKKVGIIYQDNGKKNSLSGQFKIDRNKQIIITLKKLSMPLGRGCITPDSIFMVNYFEKYYIEDNIQMIRSIFGVDLNYNLFQSLLTGDVNNLFKEEYFDKELISDIDSGNYRIDSQFKNKINKALNNNNDKRLNRYMKKMDNSKFINFTAWIDPYTFTIRKLTFNNIKNDDHLTIQYDQYELVGKSLFPQKISFKILTPEKNRSIDMKLSKSSVNKTTNFSFSIPSKFEENKLTKNE